MPNLYIVPIEPNDSKYSKQWYDNMPYQIAEIAGTLNITEKWEIITIDGKTEQTDNENRTAIHACNDINYYISTQIMEITKMFSNGTIRKGDKFLITDMRSFVVTAIKQMSNLLSIPIEIHGIWNYKQFDTFDKDVSKLPNSWVKTQEIAWFYSCDYIYFNTDINRNIYLKTLKLQKRFHKKTIVSGHSCSTIIGDLLSTNSYNHSNRKNLIVFPHSLDKNHQPKIFRDLVNYLPNNWVFYITQDHDLNKDEYYNILIKANIIFGCSLSETTAISYMEGVLCGAIPIIPDKGSYSEIFLDMFKYNPEWIADWDSYIKHRPQLVAFCINLMKNYTNIHNTILVTQHNNIANKYLIARNMYINILT